MVMIAPSNNTARGGGGGEGKDRQTDIQNDISFVTCVPSWPVPAVRWERETSRVLVLTEDSDSLLLLEVVRVGPMKAS